MNYCQALEKINSRLQFGIKPGLERERRLLDTLDNPEKKLKFVHVAGTNGKGTTSTLIASTLTEAGFRTGLFTSPFVTEFRERFRINGDMITETSLIEETQSLEQALVKMGDDGDKITEFEYITALALHWFYMMECDIVVLEVGLGGRFDATNVIPVPEVAVITSISLDHTAILGGSVEQIAFEKAGIMKMGGDVVLYPIQDDGARVKIEAISAERQMNLTVPDIYELKIESESLNGTSFSYREIPLQIGFLGRHQALNAVTAFEALRILNGKGFIISDEAVQKGFQKAFIPARLELISADPMIILDGGHNPGCALALKEAMKLVPPEKTAIAIIGMLSDKDSKSALEILGPLFETIITAEPDHVRAMPAEQLAETARIFCRNVMVSESISHALDLAFAELLDDQFIVICGSFYLAGEIRRLLEDKLAKM